MRGFETRRCPKCNYPLRVKEGSDRTVGEKVWFWMRCYNCGHTEMDWRPRKDRTTVD